MDTGTGKSRFAAFVYCAGAYALAFITALLTVRALPHAQPLVAAGLADLAATCVVFLASLASGNSSIYDPYWSLAPVPIALYFLARSPDGLTPSKILVLVPLAAWAARLTWNWASGWRGLGHEDWRYLHFRSLCGRWYWPVSFLGIHLVPTLCVYAGCLPLYAALALPGRMPGFLHLASLTVSLAAVLIEGKADRDLRVFMATRKDPGEILASGLWSVTRHPNYFGEVLFWWGAALAGAASGGGPWTAAGAAVITSLFLFVSIPLTEKRLLARHSGYSRIMKTIPPLVPWFPAARETETDAGSM